MHAVEDAVLIPAAGGEPDLVEDGLRLARELVGRRRRFRLPLDWPGTDAWIAGLEERAGDAERLHAVVEAQAVAHRLPPACRGGSSGVT